MIVILLLSPFSSLPAYATTQTEGDFRYEDNGDNTVTITGYTGAGGHVDIPDKLGGMSVTVIGAETFAIETAAFYQKGLTSVAIPNSVKVIGNNAFSKNKLTDLKIPSSVTLIGTSAFADNELESVDIPYGVETIGHTAFTNNKLTSVDIPNSVTSIKMYAFQSNYLTNLTIPDSVTSIEIGAFTLNKLTKVTFEGAVPSIDVNSFINQAGAIDFLGWFTDQDFTEPWDRTVSQSMAIYAEWTPFTYTHNPDGMSVTITGYIGTAPEDIVIPKILGGKTVTAIGQNAFRNKELTSVTIPNTVITIGDIAFGANKLTSVDIPNSVTSIGPYAFADNELVHVDIANSVNSIGEGAFRDNKLASVVIPDGVKVIREETFQKNELSNVTIPSSVTSIGNSAFQYNQLSNVTIPSNVTSIGKLAFQYNQLTNVTIPSNVKSIGNSAFQHNQLSNVTIPSSVTSIGNNAFFNNQLSKVEFEGTVPSTAFGAFDYQKQGSINYLGWFTDQDFIISWDNTVPHKITIYAKYSYKITFDTDGGTAVDKQNIAPSGKVTVPQPPTKTDHSFVGWYKEADTASNNLWDFDNDEVTADTTIYAKWTPNEYTVTFNVNEGTTVANQTIAYQQKATVPAPPTKAGHTFAGWYKEADFKTKWDFANEKVTENTTLYAKWSKNSSPSLPPSPPSPPIEETPYTYYITFNVNGGTGIVVQKQDYNNKVAEPPTPTKDGYIFGGWYKEAVFTNKWNFATDVVRENMTLYAKWVEKIENTAEPVENSDDTPELTPASACTTQFTDIAKHWAKDLIEDIAGRCIIKGYPDSTFKPNASIQRQHVAVLLTRAFDLPAIRKVQNFTDVSANHKYYDAIMQVYQAGIFDGANGQFNSDAYMTRAQMAKILVLAFELEPNGANTDMFQDVPSTHWAKSYIAILADNGIALGDNGNFKPDEPVTRAQFVAFMYRAMGMMGN